MKKIALLLLCCITLLGACKKKEEGTVRIDMTAKTYYADAMNGSIPTSIKLSFDGRSTVKISSILDFNEISNTLNYEIGDKMATNTTLHIYGVIEKKIAANGFDVGTKIDWTANIERFSYRSTVYTFTIGGYYFK